jgi:hypothetical protein
VDWTSRSEEFLVFYVFLTLFLTISGRWPAILEIKICKLPRPVGDQPNYQIEADWPCPTIIEEKVTPSDSEIFAANPELMAARRHAIEADDETPTGSELYAANPELMAAHRYSAPSIEAGVEAGSTFFANNPELMVAERYTVEDETITDSEMLAANPELKVVRQYQAAIEK